MIKGMGTPKGEKRGGGKYVYVVKSNRQNFQTPSTKYPNLLTSGPKGSQGTWLKRRKRRIGKEKLRKRGKTNPYVFPQKIEWYNGNLYTPSSPSHKEKDKAVAPKTRG